MNAAPEGTPGEEAPAPGRAAPLTRRQAIAGIAVAFGSLAAATRGRAQAQGTPRTALHYEEEFSGGPGRIYSLLLDSEQFSRMTGRAASIDPVEGGAFSLFGGLILGRNVELVPAKRVVQAWRPAHWDAGVYSIVRFELGQVGPRARMVLDHTGFPVAEADSLDSGWKGHYLEPMARFLA